MGIYQGLFLLKDLLYQLLVVIAQLIRALPVLVLKLIMADYLVINLWQFNRLYIWLHWGLLGRLLCWLLLLLFRLWIALVLRLSEGRLCCWLHGVLCYQLH